MELVFFDQCPGYLTSQIDSVLNLRRKVKKLSNLDHSDALLTTKQAAKYLAVSEAFLAKARCTGNPEIPFTCIGRSVRYRLSDLVEFVDSQMSVSTSTRDEAFQGY